MRQDEMAADDWAAFVAWLEADAAHAEAFDAIAVQDRLIAQVPFPAEAPAIVAANDDQPRRWWPLAGGAAIAAALALWLVPVATAPRLAAKTFTTRDGERRDVRLTDGTQIAMNGGTTLRLDPADPRSVRLERGEVTLHVVHDAAHPFTLRAGDQVIRDMGTTFDVTRGDGGLSVAVAEGSVLFQPDGAAVTLAAGQALTMTRGGRIVRGTIAPEAVGGWRDGLLGFDAAPVAEVAAALRHRYGIDVRLAGDLSKRPFTGMVHVTGAADRDIPHLADLIGATWRRDGEGWVLAERANPAP
nr:FecR domain-containing protein [Sphingomonas liriopis]